MFLYQINVINNDKNVCYIWDTKQHERKILLSCQALFLCFAEVPILVNY